LNGLLAFKPQLDEVITTANDIL